MIERWLAWLRVERGLLEATLRAYGREVRALSATGEPDQLTVADLRGHLERAGGQPATVARRVAAFRSFYGFLARVGVRPDNPAAALDRPRVRRGLPRPVADPEERFATLDAVSAAVAVLLRETGLRISEACSLRCPVPVPDVVRVRGKGAKERLVLLTDVARAALDELGGRVPLSARSIQRRFRAAGFTPHQLRHTFGCELAASGADLGEMQDLMGHASPATTRVYAAYRTDRLRRALDRRNT